MEYCEAYDEITAEQNIVLYDLLTDKLDKNPFVK